MIDPELESNVAGCDEKYFRLVFNIRPLVIPDAMDFILNLERDSGLTITSFEAWLRASVKAIDVALNSGAVALKDTSAYKRSLLFERPTRAYAEKEFNDFLYALYRDNVHDQIPILGHKAQNYIMHHILEAANERELVLQVHTGLQEGTGNYIAWSDPVLMTNLYIQYPGVRFDIFHIGYPYHNQLSALAKNFPNVFIDMCWAQIISPQACINSLTEWLEVVPYNKISAFGGDYAIIDAVYGHLVMARENVSRALATKVDQGLFDLDRAKEIAERLFFSNPALLFGLA
jgi:predicted TIM-barrel fold metal-dependent hydrolase